MGDGVNVKSVVRGLLLRKVRIVTFFLSQRMREEGIMSSRTLWATDADSRVLNHGDGKTVGTCLRFPL